MRTSLVKQLIESGYLEIQFRMGHKTIGKKDREWQETDRNELSLEEWKDLKDLSLTPSEIKKLDQNGFIRGISVISGHKVLFTFVENEQGMKSYIRVLKSRKVLSNIHFVSYVEGLRSSGGLHLVSGIDRSLNSQMLADLIEQKKMDSPQLCGVHADASGLEFLSSDTVVHLGGADSNFDLGHPVYDGLEQIYVDLKDVSHIQKWIEFAEAGGTVVLAVTGQSIDNAFEKIVFQVGGDRSLWKRFVSRLKSALHLLPVQGRDHFVFEALVVNSVIRNELIQKYLTSGWLSLEFSNFEEPKSNDLKNAYFSLNQSIVHALIKRTIDVPTAFRMTSDPDQLDLMLKKMGL